MAPTDVAQIGVIMTGSEPPIEGFKEELRELGLVEGHNIRYEVRLAHLPADGVSPVNVCAASRRHVGWPSNASHIAGGRRTNDENGIWHKFGAVGAEYWRATADEVGHYSFAVPL